MDRGFLLKEMASPPTRAGWWMINAKKCYQDAGFSEIRENDRAGWRVGEVPGKVCFSHGQDAKGSGWCQRLRILSGENDQGQWPWRWKRRGVLRICPPAASSWRPWPSLLGQDPCSFALCIPPSDTSFSRLTVLSLFPYNPILHFPDSLLTKSLGPLSVWSLLLICLWITECLLESPMWAPDSNLFAPTLSVVQVRLSKDFCT